MTASRRERDTAFWVGALALAVVHVALVNYFVPFRAVFSHTPLTGDDYDLHIGQVYRVVEGLEGWGKSWVYDVQLLAGQPEGTILDSGSKGWELFTYLLAHVFGVDRAVAFNVFVLGVMLGAPKAIYFAGRAFELPPRTALVAAAMTSTLWFFDSHIHWLWFVGMISWAGAACLAPLTIGLFYRLLTRSQLVLAAPCAVCLGVGLLVHPYTFFAVGPSMLALYARSARALPRRGHLAVVGIAVVALAMNAYWLRNAALHWHYVLDSAFYAQGGPRFLVCDFFDVLCSGADSGVIGTRTGFRFLYLGLGVAGLFQLFRLKDERFLPLFVGVASLYFFAYVGGALPGLAQTQPYRQITPAAFLTTLPAAAFVDAFFRERRHVSHGFATTALLAVLGVALFQRLVAGDALYFLPRLIPEPARLLDGSPSPLSKYGFFWESPLPSHVHYGVPHEAYLEQGIPAVVDWLGKHVPAHERVLAEGATLGERLAWQGRYEVLGGFVERNVAHAYANYFRQYKDQSPEEAEVARYLHVFAVNWVVSDRPEFARYPEVVEHVATVGNWNVYRTLEPVNRILAGGGTVDASENLLRVRGSDPASEILLSYHFHEALRCRPSCTVERSLVDIDRVGLLRVPAPHPADLDVYNSYEMR
ncbi:MAG TPA: hypothetical protein VH062_28500 [Polyangiaceae bacterium]|jgi:hypothetical protein|nr:hypothetical protein [Polyangiaceae bacterium]